MPNQTGFDYDMAVVDTARMGMGDGKNGQEGCSDGKVAQMGMEVLSAKLGIEDGISLSLFT